jgi:hypothetical protein
MDKWSDGTPKSTNNAFTISTERTPKKYPKKPGRIKLTKVQAAAVTFMTKSESKAFREHLTLQKQKANQ